MTDYVKTPFKRALTALTPYANKYFPKKARVENQPSSRVYLRKALGGERGPLSLEPLVEISERLSEASSFFLFIIFITVYLALDLSCTRVLGWLNSWSSAAAYEILKSQDLVAGQSLNMGAVPLSSTISLMFNWGFLPVSHTMNQRLLFLPSQVDMTLASYGPWGRFLYWCATLLEMGGGIALGAIFGILFSYMITESREFHASLLPLLRRLPKATADTLSVLIPCANVLPLFYSVSLLAENSILLWTVWFYPSVSSSLLLLANVFSLMKWSLFIVSFSLVLFRLPWVMLSWWTTVGRDGRQKIPQTPAKTPNLYRSRPAAVTSTSYYQSDSPLRSKSKTSRASFFD